MNVEPAGRSSIHQDDVERGALVVLLIPDVLSVELLADEAVLHLVRPVHHHGELLLAGAAVHPEEEFHVVRHDGTEGDARIQGGYSSFSGSMETRSETLSAEILRARSATFAPPRSHAPGLNPNR